MFHLPINQWVTSLFPGCYIPEKRCQVQESNSEAETRRGVTGVAAGFLFGSEVKCSTLLQILGGGFIFFYFHPYLGKMPILNIFFKWVETTN